MTDEHQEREGEQESAARHFMPEVHGDQVEVLCPSGHRRMPLEEGEDWEDSQGVSCTFHEFGRERVQEDMEQGLLPKEKQKQVAEEGKEMMEGQFRAEMVEVLGWIKEWLKH